MYERRVEPVGEILRDPGNPDIVADMPGEFGFRQAKIVQGDRDTVPVMVRNEQDRGAAIGIAFAERNRVPASQDGSHDIPESQVCVPLRSSRFAAR